MNKEIVLIGNPVAGGSALKKIETAVKIIKNREFNVRLMLTGEKGDAEKFAREISQHSKLNSKLLIIVAGGDGTYNEVINGIAGSNIPMAILPLGTTNVLASELNIPSNLEKAIHIALNGKPHAIHIGKITCHEFGLVETNQDSELSVTHRSSLVTRYFLLMAGIGFDGEVVFGVNEKIKKYSGKGAYILSGLKTLLRYNPAPITIDARGESGEIGSMKKLVGYTAIIGNASCYGGSFKITPDAKLTEPYLYIFVVHGKGRLRLLRCILRILKGGHLRLNDISYLKTSYVEIEGSVHVQIDGDYLGMTPAKIETVPHALKLVF